MTGHVLARRQHDRVLRRAERGVGAVQLVAGGAAAREAEVANDVVLDAVFGFSFYGEPRAPFDGILRDLERTATPLVSVDTPSGWHVEDGPTGPVKLAPDVLVSLTAPKKCASHFAGRHYVGGRFVPPRVAEKYGLELSPYPGASQILELPNWGP